MLKNMFGKTKAEFKSKYSIDESVIRLKNVVRSGWSFHLRAGVYGSVSNKRVRLYRVIPLVGNSFIPVFIGSFRHHHGQVVLSGHFSMHTGIKVFMGAWFAAVIFVTVNVLIEILKKISTGELRPSELEPLYLIPLGMLIFGMLLVKLGQWFSRNDITYISKAIKDAISD